MTRNIHMNDVVALCHKAFMDSRITARRILFPKISEWADNPTPHTKDNMNAALEVIDYFKMTLAQKTIQGNATKFDGYVLFAIDEAMVPITNGNQALKTLMDLVPYYYDRKYKYDWIQSLKNIDVTKEQQLGAFNEIVTIGFVALYPVGQEKDATSKRFLVKFLSEDGNIIYFHDFLTRREVDMIRPGSKLRIQGFITAYGTNTKFGREANISLDSFGTETHEIGDINVRTF